MAIYQTEAIVLGVHNWGDADKIVTFFTKDRGKVRAAAFGCRRPRSPLAGGMQMFNRLEVRLSEGAKLHTVKTCSLISRNKKITEDLTTMAYASFMAEAALLFSPEGEQDTLLYERLCQIIEAFSQRNPRVTADAAVFQILEAAGMQLHIGACVHCGKKIEKAAVVNLRDGGALCADCTDTARDVRENLSIHTDTIELIEKLSSFDWKSGSSMNIKGSALIEAEHILTGYLFYLFGKPMKSLEFLQQIVGK